MLRFQPKILLALLGSSPNQQFILKRMMDKLKSRTVCMECPATDVVKRRRLIK